MKRILYTFFSCLFCFSLFAQPCNTPAPGEFCPIAPLFCPDELDAFCGTTSMDPLTSTPTPFCGSVESDKWFKFQAAAETVIIELVPSNCLGTPTGSGIQAEIYYTENCGIFTS